VQTIFLKQGDFMDASAEKRVVVLGTGGTIAGLASAQSDNVGYTAAQVPVSALLMGLVGTESEQVAQVDSKDMGFAVWEQLLARVVYHLEQASVLGIVIAHGTDTLEETAYFLHACLQGSAWATKPIVLTCAMRPASAQFPDGPQNLADAVAVVRDPQAHGVLAVCAGRLHSAVSVQKCHTYRLDAFSSGEAGALGAIEEGCVRWYRALPAVTGLGAGAMQSVVKVLLRGQAQAGLQAQRQALAPTVVDASALTVRWPRVEIVLSHAGVTGQLVDLLTGERRALLASGAQARARAAVEGIVVACTGNGTLHHELEAALLRAQQTGIVVWRTSRCFNANIVEGAAPVPFPSQGDLTPVKARVAMLLYLLSEHTS
jgi:L-asparaginase